MFEAYRKFYFEGLRLTPKHAFTERAALWSVQEAPSMEKLMETIEVWETKLDYVQEQQNYTLSNDDKV